MQNTTGNTRQNYQSKINHYDKEKLEAEMQTELKRLNAALLVNSTEHLKRQSEKIVILNRKLKLKK